MAKKLTPNEFKDAEAAMRATLDPLVRTFQDNVLQDVQGEVIVAGGYIRDTIVGVRPKDIDVFVRIDVEDPFDYDEAAEAVAERLTTAPFYGYKAAAGDYGKNTDFSVMKGEYRTGGDDEIYFDVDFILHDRQIAQDTLDYFDINVCKAAYVDGEFVYDKQFLEGINSKVVLITPDYSSSDISIARADRIRKKLNRVWFPKKPAVKNTQSFYTTVDGGSIWTTVSSNPSTAYKAQ